MKYSEKMLNTAFNTLNQKRLLSKEKSMLRTKEIYQKHPDLEFLDSKLAQTGIEISKTILTTKGDDLQNKLEELKKHNLDIQEQRQLILTHLGIDDDYLDDEFFCSKCEDTGYVNGAMCSCLKKTLDELAYRELCNDSPLANADCSFDNFSLNYYSKDSATGTLSPYDRMSQNLAYCKNYCHSFSPLSKSIIMEGRTGLGKTHLSIAISKEIIKQGVGVVYTTAQDMFSNCEREHFGRATEDKNSLQSYCACDLLVIDDLGSELTTKFTVSVLYNIINQRTLYKKPTIISTNLSMQEIMDKYDEKTTSRIMGNFDMLSFTGSDIRILAKMNKA